MALGDITTKYETGGIGTSSISNTKGDKGGASYGKFQLSHKMGSLKEFLGLLNKTNPEAYAELAPLWDSAGSGKAGAFGKKWIELANGGKLQDAETAYAMNNYLKGGLALLKDKELADRIRNSPALQEAFLSTTTQHGPTGGAGIWNRIYKQGMDDKTLTSSIYTERGRANPDGSLVYFSGNSPSVQRAVAARFKDEIKDIHGLIDNNGGGEASPTTTLIDRGTPTNPNEPRPSAEPYGFTNPIAAQSVQNRTPVPVSPMNQGFVGRPIQIDYSRPYLDAVNQRNAEIAAMANGLGFTGIRPNLGLG